MFEVELTFHGDLNFFLHRDLRIGRTVRRTLSEKTAVKDVIEASGVPHPEVDLILTIDADDPEPRPVDFTWQVQAAQRLEIHPVPAPATLLPTTPRLQVRRCCRFIADGHLGKLARNLRLLGLDTAYDSNADDRRLLEIMIAEDRALLTRDRRLLMHSIVRHGYCPRSPNADIQAGEVLARFALRESPSPLRPYSRCLRCNGLLEMVKKEAVLAPLAGEPRTLRYYDSFRRCAVCGQIYWPGTHFEKLAARVANLLGH
jgi:uncharacterized protein